MNTDTVHSSWQQWQLHRSIHTTQSVDCFLWPLHCSPFQLITLRWTRHLCRPHRRCCRLWGLVNPPVLDGAIRFGSQAFPLVISQRTPVNRLDEFDRDNLPLFAYIEVAEDRDYDALTDSWEVETTEFLVEPVGYLVKVSWKMWETIEMGFWGTFISIMISLPLGILSSRNYTPHRIVYSIARGWLSLHRPCPS